MNPDPFLDSTIDYPRTDRIRLFEEQWLINKLYDVLEDSLKDHCQGQAREDSEDPLTVPIEYHAIVAIQAETPTCPMVTWYCGTCHMIFKYGRFLNAQYDRVHTALMSSEGLAQENDRRMTHPMCPPFPQPSVENIVEVLHEEAIRENSPEHFGQIGFLQLGANGHHSYPY